jgi:diguanylate cyclase (GGDEF)-like protein
VEEDILRSLPFSGMGSFGEVLVALGQIMSSWEEHQKILKVRNEMLEQEKHVLQESMQEMEKELQRMRHLATRDPLTDLPNRRLFEENLRFAVGRARRHDEPLSLAMLDIDRFKEFNDTSGHIEGDRVLKELGDILYQISRQESDVVARYGGEEFALILTKTPIAGAMRVAERIRQAVERELPFTVSIGVASYSGRIRSPQELLLAADKALYRAKREGRNRVGIFENGNEDEGGGNSHVEKNGR